MLITLRGRHLRALTASSPQTFTGRICDQPTLPLAARSREILMVRAPLEHLPPGFRAYLLHEPVRAASELRDVYLLGEEMRYLAAGDVVRIEPRRQFVSALYRRSSSSNSMLVTERCDNHCLMCSQPPKPQDDAWLVDELMTIIPLISPDTREIGITGGEPGLLGPRLVGLVDTLSRHLPRTAVHVLSNGRAFSDKDFARSLSRVRHPDLMLGIPIYSDLPEEHDYVVQARGAFSQTIRGILNLKQHGVKVEVRVVIHADTYRRLPELATFLTRNLLFVDHVALMGLELMGFAKTNVETLWIDPIDYQPPLVEAVQILDRARMNVSIYNHQLCVLDRRLHPFSRKSISDWKNTYFDACTDCSKRADCGGFFASSTLRRSRSIAAIAEAAPFEG